MRPFALELPRRARAALWLLLLSSVLAGAGEGRAMDRSDLLRVLGKIPPNGPLWQHGNVRFEKRSRAAGAEPVVFTHWSHRVRYACRVCHLELDFSMRSGSSGVTREQCVAGRFCGACHDGKIAFSARGEEAQCGRCHLRDPGDLERRFEAFAARLPSSRFGNGIDWAAAVRKGLVEPAPSLQVGLGIPRLPQNLRRPMKLGTTSPRSDVVFSHEAHFAELDCSNCHPDLFNVQKRGTREFTMSSNIFGEFCGACHLRVAFPVNDCRRCHAQMSSRPGPEERR